MQSSGFPELPHTVERQGRARNSSVRLLGRARVPSDPLGFLLTCQLESAVTSDREGRPHRR